MFYILYERIHGSYIFVQFDLVCEDAYKADLATTIYFCGVTLGGIFFGVLADKFGRKPIIAVTLLATGVIGVTVFLFRTYIAFVVLRFFLGLVIQVILLHPLGKHAARKLESEVYNR